MVSLARQRGFWLVLLVAGVGLASCREDRARDAVVQVGRALTVGAAELPLAVATMNGRGDYSAPARVACNGASQCLAVWSQLYKDGFSVVARRFNATGPIDALVTVLGSVPPTLSPNLAVAARANGDFLVGWSTVGDSRITLSRIDAATGAALDNPPAQIGDATGGIAQILVVDGGYVVVYGSADAAFFPVWRAARVAGGAVQDVPGLLLGPGSPAAFAAGPGQVAIARSDGLVRFSLASGVLDATPIAFNAYAVGQLPSLAFDGNNYLALWTFSERTYAARVRASDGVRLDPPDDFNQIAGGHVIATGLTLSQAKTFFDGTNFLSFWFSDTSMGRSLVATRVSTAAARVQGATTTPYEIALTNSIAGDDFDVSHRPGLGMVAWGNFSIGGGVTGFSMQVAAGALPSPPSYFLSLSYGGSIYEAPAVASNGHDFLVAYREQSGYAPFAMTIDGVTGAAAGPAVPLASGGAQDSMTVVWTGSVYLFVAPIYREIKMRVLSCAGQPLGAETPVGIGLPSSVACNPDRCAIVYADGQLISARRVRASDGAFIDTQAIEVDGSTPLFGTPVVVADTQPIPSMRTFLVVYPGAAQIVARRLRSDLGAVTTATTVAVTSTPVEVRAASDGRQFFVSWIDGGRVRGTLIDAISGLPTLAVPLDIAPGVEIRSVTHDGSSFLVFWHTATDLRGARVSPAGADLDGDGFLVNSIGDGRVATAGGAPFGRTLAVYQAADPRAFAHVLRARFIDNDLGAGIAGRGPACAPPTGTGGAAGGGMGGNGAGGSGTGGSGTGGNGTGGNGAGGNGGRDGGAGGMVDAGSDRDGGDAAGSGGRGTGGTAGGAGGATGAGGSAGGTTDGGRGGAGGAAGAPSGTDGAIGADGATVGSGRGGGCSCDLGGGAPGLGGSLASLAMLIAARRRRGARDRRGVA